jgi:hypothetical protein
VLFATLLRRLTTTGVRKGMAGSRGWLIVGVVAGGVRLLRWVARDETEVLYRTAIKPGDVFEVVTRPRTK